MLEASFENEFTLALPADGGYRPVDESLCFSTIGMTARRSTSTTLADALERQAIVLEQYYAELGHGQQEISTGHAPALRAADEQILVRETIRGVAARLGYVASLAPKPWPDAAGNGGHIHFSLWSRRLAQPLLRRRRARTASPTRPRVVHRRRAGPPARALRADGAELQLLPPASCRTTGRAPSPAGATTTARRRFGSPPSFARRRGGSTNAELKACDATCNPYLALGGLIAAGLDGLERGLDAARAGRRSTRRRSPRTSARAAASSRLPATQEEALDALAADDDCSRRRSGRCSPTSYLAVRRSEWTAYSAGGRGHSSSAATSQVLMRRPRRIPLVDHHAHGILRGPPAASTSSAACSARAPTRASGRTSRRASPTGARSGCSRALSASRRPRRPSTSAGSRPSRERVRALARRGDEHRAPAPRRRLPARGRGTSWQEFGELAGVPARPVLRLETRGADGRRTSSRASTATRP